MDIDPMEYEFIHGPETNYYFLVPYFKKFKTFFASDIYDALVEDDFVFSRGQVLSGINEYMKRGKIVVSDIPYYNGDVKINKYIWKEQKEINE